MKAMKSMRSVFGSVRGRPNTNGGSSDTGAPGAHLDTPEANAARSVRLFCESGGPNNSGEEVLHLPTIVEAAESSPAAAKECAQVIRKFLTKDHYSRAHVQYNGIMLVRILSDNPGPTFTRNLDKKFVETVKELLRNGRDPSVKQILIETLDTFQRVKKQDEGLALLLQMWEKEQGKMAKAYGSNSVQNGSGARVLNAPPFDPHSQNYFSRSHTTNRPLPAPHELSSRIEEAKTSAKLLIQLVQSTPPTEFFQNDLIREFADRCQSASRSIQGYITAQNPPPDNDTMLTLIETNEQLALAMSKHQRAVLLTRRTLGMGGENGSSNGPTPNRSPEPGNGYVAPPPGPPPNSSKPPPAMPPRNAVSAASQPVPQEASIPVKRESASPELGSSQKPEDPFKDPAPSATQNQPFPADGRPPSDQFHVSQGVEPYHPGFNPTQSYMGRQESAIGKVALSGAVPATPEAEDTAKEVVTHHHAHAHAHEEEDAYDASPVQSKAPIYRY